jgi:cystathionine beta-lyase family protein involved in aluminum resistance
MELSTKVLELIERLELELQPEFAKISRIAFYNQQLMLDAFQAEKIGSHHFQTTNGYGYHDLGRDALEKVFSRVFKAEASLVRQQLVSGTHAIACAILGNLTADDELVIASGCPYETLLGVLGIQADDYKEMTSTTGGFKVNIVPLAQDGSLDLKKIIQALTPKTKMVSFQRSCGYSERDSISIAKLRKVFTAIKQIRPDIIIFVDNCYGEFVEDREPLEVGAHLLAGSLIKNPGGCLVPCGGYISGRSDLVEKAAERLYAPKIGSAIGPSLINLQPFFQGFFEAPHRVSEIVKGIILAARLFQLAGYRVSPLPNATRTDIIQKIYFQNSSDLIRFCQAVQRNSPVESYLTPEPAPMPGYQHHVIMGGGTFTSGSTSEFSADAPLLAPFIAFLQGGLSYTQIKLSLARVYQEICL